MRGLRWIGVGVVLVPLSLALASCADSATAPPVLPVRVTVSPSGTVELRVGETLEVQAVVENATRAGGVSFSSSDSTVARVTERGLVQALSPGIATVTATSVQDPSAKNALLVRVLPLDPEPPVASGPSVLISELLDAEGRTVDASSVHGTLFVRLTVVRDSASSAQVLLGDRLACELPLAGSALAAPAVLLCPIDTARFDSATAQPTFVNGPATLQARLLGGNDSVLAAAAGVQVTLRNPDRLIASVSAAREAQDSLGRRWVGGDLTVQAFPVVYDLNARVSRVIFSYDGPGGRDTTATDAEPPFQITLSGSGILAGLTDADLTLRVASVTGEEQQGPVLQRTGAVRYDNVAPAPGRFLPRDWIGSIPFLRVYSDSGQADAGVGRVRVQFYAGIADLPTPALLSDAHAVASGAELAEAAAGAYRLAARVCDALENCAVVNGFPFGVDLQAPQLVALSLADQAVNPTQDLAVAVQDDRSGFPPAPLEVSVLVQRPGAAAPDCGPLVDGVDLPGRLRNLACVPDTVGLSVAVPRTTAGYYRYSITALDRAGNRSLPAQRAVLVDAVAPAISEVALPAQLSGGAEATVSASATDNVDLVSLGFRLVFPRPNGGTLALPLTPAVRVGVAFDDTLTTGASASVSLPVVRALAFGGNSPRTVVLVDSLQVRATDAAGRSTRVNRAIPPQALTSISAVDPFGAIGTATATSGSALLCTGGCIAGEITSTTVTARFTGESGFESPFERVYFYLQAPDGVVTLLGSDASPAITESSSQRVVTYELPVSGFRGVSGDFLVFAVGVSRATNDPARSGVGLKTTDSPLRLFSRGS